MASQPDGISWEALRMLLERVPVVQRLSADQRAMLEDDLRSMASDDRDFTLEKRWFGIEERLRQEGYAEELEPLTPEELAELERRMDEAEAHPETLIPWEEVRAKLGIAPTPPRDLFEVLPPLSDVERRFLAGLARSPDEAEAAAEALAARALKRPEEISLPDFAPDP
jgi:putative addiction module component (TIGR02574 family)